MNNLFKTAQKFDAKYLQDEEERIMGLPDVPYTPHTPDLKKYKPEENWQDKYNKLLANYRYIQNELRKAKEEIKQLKNKSPDYEY